MSFIDLENFKSVIKDIARPNRFRVDFFGLEYLGLYIPEHISYYIKSVTLPALSYPAIEVHKYGNTIPVSSDHVFNEVVMTFVNDYELKIRKFMEKWFKKIQTYPDTHKTDFITYSKAGMYIYHLGRQGEITAGWKFHNVIPISLSEVDLNMDNESSQETFTVNFKYSFFEDVI